MAIVAVDGFDLYNGVGANTGVQAKWALTSTTSISLVAGRFSGQAVQCTIGSSAAHMQRILPATYAAFTDNFAARFTTLTGASPSNTTCPFRIYLSGATYMLGIKVNSSGQLEVFRMSATYAGTLLGTSTACIVVNTWHFIEAAFEISDTVGTVTIKVDGTTVLTLSAQDTRNGTPTTIDRVQYGDVYSVGFGGAWVGQFDDMFVTDSITFTGERRVETLRPSADVTQTFGRSAGTANYSLVNETLVDGDTTYVQGTTVGDTDTYGLSDLTGTPTNISAVQISVFAEKTDATSRSIALQAKSGATTSDGGNFTLAASYSKFERLLLTDPNTSAAWSVSGVNALQCGPKVTV